MNFTISKSLPRRDFAAAHCRAVAARLTIVFGLLCSAVAGPRASATPPGREIASNSLPARPQLEVTIDDVSQPKVIELSAATNLKLRQGATPQKLSVYSLFATLQNPSAAGMRSVVDFDGPEIELGVVAPYADPFGAPGTQRAYVVVVGDSTREAKPLILGPSPGAGASLKELALYDRNLSARKFSILKKQVGRAGAFSPSLELAALFGGIDTSYFVYSQSKTCRGMIDPGEPLLVLSAETRGKQVVAVDVLRANGHTVGCVGPELSTLSTKRPSALHLPVAFARTEEVPSYFFQDEKFLERAATDPAIAKYAEQKAAATVCAEEIWRKLDPDARAGHYDVATIGRNGQVTKIESMWSRIDRQANAKCKVDALLRARDRILEAQKAASLAESQQSLDTAKTRFAVSP